MSLSQTAYNPLNATSNEEKVLGALLLEPNKIVPMAEEVGLRSKHFETPIHAKFWSFLFGRAKRGETIEPLELAALCPKELKELNGAIPAVNQIGIWLSDTPSTHHFKEHAGFVIEAACLRRDLKRVKRDEAKIRAGNSVGTAFPKFFYDGTKYYLDSENAFVPINEASTKRHLRKAGSGSDEIEDELCRIQTENFIVFAGPLAGKSRGIHETNGQKVLAVNSPQIIKTKSGPFPTLQKVIQGLLGEDETQIQTLYGWLKIARESLLSEKRGWGQVLALAGERGSGKSLLIDIIEKLLGGRRANPYKYFTGRTGFNADLAGAELLAVDDEAGSTNMAARKNLGAAIKANLFSGKVSIEGKHKTPFTFAPFWRMVIALNDEPECLLVLPPITEDIADKIIMLKCRKFNFPMEVGTSEEKERFFNQLVDEMPGFLDSLEKWEIPSHLKEERCGVKHYHEPSILEGLAELSPESGLLSLIHRANEDGALPLPWEGTADGLKSILFECDSTRRDAEKLLGNWMSATGSYLGKLEGTNVEKLTKRRGIQRWRVNSVV